MYIQNTSISLGNYLGTLLIIGNVMIIRVTSVERTWLGLEWPPTDMVNVDLLSVDVDDVAPLIILISDAKCHASLFCNFLSNNSLYFGVNDITSFEKLVGNLNKMTIANLGRQHHRSLDSYFKRS